MQYIKKLYLFKNRIFKKLKNNINVSNLQGTSFFFTNIKCKNIQQVQYIYIHILA